MNKQKSIKILAETWIYSFIILFLFVCGMLAFVGSIGLVVIPITIFTLAPLLISILVFIFSEPIIIRVMGCERIENNKLYEQYVTVVNECMKDRWMFRRPRLYVSHKPKTPNAFAFGWGIFGEYAIAVTPELLQLMNRSELKAVVAHELAHIVHMDVIVMTVISIMKFIINYSKKIVFRTFGLAGWIIWIFGWLTDKIVKLFVMLYSQEREIAADTKSALITNDPQSMIDALQKLQSYHSKNSESKLKKETTIVDDLMISHPKMSERIENLRNIK